MTVTRMLRNQIFNGQNSGSARAFLNFPVVNPEGEFVGGVLDPPYPTKGFFFTTRTTPKLLRLNNFFV